MYDCRFIKIISFYLRLYETFATLRGNESLFLRTNLTNMKHLITGLLIFLITSSLSFSQKSFTFVFMTDIHIRPERQAPQGFTKAIESINKLKPDLVITGGDLVMDALEVRYSRADSVYNLYTSLIKKVDVPVYNTIGNHEHFAVCPEAGPDTLNPEAGTKLFEHRIGKTYQSFTHKGWKFFLLNSVQIDNNRHYYGGIDSVQMEWIKMNWQQPIRPPRSSSSYTSHSGPYSTRWSKEQAWPTIPQE
jgi:predicted MPP superfamily phosphohydrolase